ncbi:LOW QUALITY PROTEIN: hypothetical protein PFFVO_02849 [Plasmodium falciparum Vietnam Oak-Knoll (FVO)]|uniref:Uncharacterized protein n=1 Tax=Plasmodium falciparum Vietnam Oak-Knoll (FVO) TaxID=1036723 RepID=A0A024V5P0_PLAFA|nr:LOW QUALITY PROTEIN: hypothetical protein PFFVO_02849 [Plasmodium falciparum Vietnam Oak-Knoll (FVO)]
MAIEKITSKNFRIDEVSIFKFYSKNIFKVYNICTVQTYLFKTNNNEQKNAVSINSISHTVTKAISLYVLQNITFHNIY